MPDTRIPLEVIHEVRDRCLCLATQRAARLLARRFDRVFAPLGLTNGQFSLMVALSGPWSPKLGELAGFLAMDSATMTAAARALQKRGLLEISADRNDARARRPRLTEAGRDLVARAVPLWRQEHARLDADMSGVDTGSLAGLLRQLG
jgi:DNA-binding MarR family transcriptional regulator